VHRGTLDAGPAPYSDAKPLPLTLFVPPGIASEDVLVGARVFVAPGGFLLTGRVAANRERQIEIADTISLQRGRHEWQMGVDYRQILATSNPPREHYNYYFNNPAALQDGRVRSLYLEHDSPARALFQTWSAFVQDAFAVTRRVSVSAGLRYTVEAAPVSANDIQPLLLDFDALPNTVARPTGAPFWNTSPLNLAPRLATAYQVRTTPRYETTVRAGWGLTFGERSSSGASAFGRGYPYSAATRMGTLSEFPAGPGELSVPLPDPFSDAAFTEYYAFPTNWRTPRVSQWHVKVEQTLRRAQVNLSYVGAAARDLPYWSAYHLGVDGGTQVNVFTNDAKSDYHALLAEYVQRLSRGFSARATYAWSHAIDNDSGEALAAQPPLTQVLPSTNRGSADFDRRHVLTVVGSFRFPAQRLPVWLRPLGAGWQADAVISLRSGGPVTVVAPMQATGDFILRPNVVPGVPQWISDPDAPTGRRINPNAFVIAADSRHGTLGRNTVRASGLRQIDLALSRSIPLGGHKSAQLRLQALNVLNTPNFGPPNSTLNDPQFGKPYQSYADRLGSGTLSYGGLTPLQQSGGPRAIQFGVRFNF
jgi:hypothetical protein